MQYFSAIATEIKLMAYNDQAMRMRNIEDDSWDTGLDRRHTERMKEIIAQIGWPTISKVGPMASDMAWLLLQHADHDAGFQQICLDLMKSAAAREVKLKNIAMLEDRVRVNTARPQLYGTQFRPVDGKHVPLEIEDPEHVNERRAQMGLGTLEEGIASMYQAYGPPKQD